jgi:WD40 repeat protein
VFTADGRTLATLSGTWDPTAHLELWQVPSGTLITSHALLPEHFGGGGNGKLALAPDLSWAAVAGHRLSVVDLATDHERWGIDCDPDSPGFSFLALLPDGKCLVSCGGQPANNSSIAVWDTASGKQIGPHIANQFTGILAVSPEGSTLVSSDIDKAMRIWDFSDPTRIHQRGRPLRGHRSGAGRAVLARDGRTLITSSADHSMYAWDIQHPRVEPAVATVTNILTWAFGPDNDDVVTLARDGEVAKWQGPGMETKTVLLKSSETDGPVEDNRLSDNGCWYAQSCPGGLVKIWDLRRHAEPRQFTVDSKSPNLWGLSADGTKLLVNNNDSQVSEWDATKGRKDREWTISRPVLRVQVDNGLSRILLCKERPADTLSILDIATDQRREVSSPLTRPLEINFSDDGSLFAVCNFLGYIRIWDTSSLRVVCTLGGQQTPHYSLSFSPDRTRLLAGCTAGLCFRLYDLKSKQELISVPGGRTQTYARFSPDGNRIGALNRFTLHIHRAPTFAEIDAAEHSQGSSSSSR